MPGVFRRPWHPQPRRVAAFGHAPQTITRELQDTFTFEERFRLSGVISFEVNAGGAFAEQIKVIETHDLSDAFTFSDQIEHDVELDRELQDSLSFSEVLDTANVFDRELQETFSFSDQIQTADVVDRELQDSFTFTDQLQTELAFIGRELQEALSFTEQILTEDVFTRDLQDALTFSDDLTHTVTEEGLVDPAITSSVRIKTYLIGELIP